MIAHDRTSYLHTGLQGTTISSVTMATIFTITLVLFTIVIYTHYCFHSPHKLLPSLLPLLWQERLVLLPLLLLPSRLLLLSAIPIVSAITFVIVAYNGDCCRVQGGGLGHNSFREQHVHGKIGFGALRGQRVQDDPLDTLPCDGDVSREGRLDTLPSEVSRGGGLDTLLSEGNISKEWVDMSPS